MNGRVTLLAGVLIVQLVLVAVVMLSGGGQDEGQALLAFEPDAVRELKIDDADGGSIVLSREAAGWQVDGLPADGGKIEALVDALAGGTAGWPVATSAESRERFEVTAAAHQRRLLFSGEDGPLAEVYLGTSPGFRRVHARREGDDAVYSIDFAVHEAPTGFDDWLDKQLFRTEGVRRIELPGGAVLARADDDGGWTLDGAATDPDAAQRYVDRIERLSVLGRYEPDEEDTLRQPQQVLVEDTEGTYRLTFRFDENDDEYVLTSDRRAGEFIVASYIVEQVLVDGSDLLPAPADDGAEDPAEGEEEAASGSDAGAANRSGR